jgi:hypothetical protein
VNTGPVPLRGSGAQRLVAALAAMLAAAMVTADTACSRLSASPAPASPPAVAPAATPNQNDLELLPKLMQLGFQIYTTPIVVHGFVFDRSGVDYEGTSLGLEYGGFEIVEWHVATFNPASGFCKPEVVSAGLSYCASLGRSSKGRAIYGGLWGGLPGGSPDFEHFYVVLNSTGVFVGTSRGLTLEEIDAVVDSLAPATPAQVISLNQQARTYADSLRANVASRIDFKTYLPQGTIPDFARDKAFLLNPTDPIHPYLYIHFGRVVPGVNVAIEFTVYEYRDDIPLGTTHCGFLSPELDLPDTKCPLLQTSPKGVKVYSTYGTTRFDRGSTRITMLLDVHIDNVALADMAAFVDSFQEVDARTIPAG